MGAKAIFLFFLCSFLCFKVAAEDDAKASSKTDRKRHWGPRSILTKLFRSAKSILPKVTVGLPDIKGREEIDKSVKSIIEKAYETAKNHTRNNRAAIDQLVDVLLEKETLTGDEFRSILAEFTETVENRSEMNNVPPSPCTEPYIDLKARLPPIPEEQSSEDSDDDDDDDVDGPPWLTLEVKRTWKNGVPTIIEEWPHNTYFIFSMK